MVSSSFWLPGLTRLGPCRTAFSPGRLPAGVWSQVPELLPGFFLPSLGRGRGGDGVGLNPPQLLEVKKQGHHPLLIRHRRLRTEKPPELSWGSLGCQGQPSFCSVCSRLGSEARVTLPTCPCSGVAHVPPLPALPLASGLAASSLLDLGLRLHAFSPLCPPPPSSRDPRDGTGPTHFFRGNLPSQNP